MIKNENFAERLFCDLRNAEFKLVKPLYTVDGNKIGEYTNMYQLNIFEYRGKFLNGRGATSLNIVNANLTFTEAYNNLLSDVKSISKELRFYSLVIPKNCVIEAKLEEFEKVVSRYVIDYLQGSDEIVARWDILVGSASD